ncbi:MAG: methyl-accepting chemotaxis protein [Alphaproteobacteria bacterium]|nr:methyl-accepting chemotaxis protein [Alphaproteobacteria bacterium]
MSSAPQRVIARDGQPKTEDVSAASLADRIAKRVTSTLQDKIESIKEVTLRSQILAFNASIEAARAGAAGKGFALIAEEMRSMSEEVDGLARALRDQLLSQVSELTARTRESVEAAEEKRLIDLSLNAVELIDRNLYERSCDVRWWATDAAVVDCAAQPTEDNCAFASRRLGVILNAYTVYLDLWLCDRSGRVIANGRPDRYAVAGTNVSGAAWFRDAMKSASGDEFVCADIEENPNLGGAAVATYAAAVRQGGESRGRVVGVLGIHFDWTPQAQGIVKSLRLSEEEWRDARAMLLDSKGRVIAASDDRGVLSEHFVLATSGQTQGAYKTKECATIGFARTPGYETYEGMGWYGCVVRSRT